MFFAAQLGRCGSRGVSLIGFCFHGTSEQGKVTKKNLKSHINSGGALWRSALCLAALLLCLAPFTFAQTTTTADALGVVTDTSGGVVPGAKVTIKSLDTGETRSETANGQGEYRFPQLKPGMYELSASSAGLKSNTSKIELLVSQAQEVNLVMNPQGTATTVEVTANVSVLQKENADRESNFNKQQVDDLPAPGGDLTTLAYTAPGIVINVKGGSGNITVNGIAGTTTLYTLDGMDQNDPANNLNNSGASNNLLGANAVGEVAVVMNAYSPQYGRMAGAQVNMVGMTGANQFHGNAFYNFNFEKLNANSFFNNSSGTPRTRSDAHQFGGLRSMAADPTEYGTLYIGPHGRGVMVGRPVKGA